MLSSIFGSKGAFKSLTFWGVFSAVATTLVANFQPDVLPTQIESGLQIVGTAVAVLGLRKSNTKAVAEMAELVEALAAKRKQSGG